jgi:hypothetical protein
MHPVLVRQAADRKAVPTLVLANVLEQLHP